MPRARELLEKAHGLSASAPVIRQDRARRLREVSKRKSLLQEKRAELRELEFGSGSEAVESAELEKSYADCQQRIGRTKAEIEKVEADLRELDNEMDNAGSELRALEKKEYAAEKNSTRLKIAVALRESFSEYRKAMRAAKRGQIESALNDRFSQLMSGHELVHHIHVDEAFIVHLQDAEGRPVGRSSISHGMRQLVVTALLWALKDVSGRGLPVIVDTPLARIDRGNQENLLRHYYPNAADQVIVLATDSELDERKFEILRPHLSKFMILHNADGESTTVLAAEAKGAGYAAAEDANG